MPDQNQPTDPSQNPAPGGGRPVLTTEEVPATSAPPTQDPSQPPTPPPIPDTSDVPPPPPGSELTDTVIPPGPGATDNSPSFDLPPIVGAPPKKRFGGKKVISTILGLLLLIGGIGAGVVLVKQNQDIGERAACSPSECNDSKDPNKKCGVGEICKAKCCVAKTGGGGTSDCGPSSAGSCQGENVGKACGKGGTCKNPPNCSCQGQAPQPPPDAPKDLSTCSNASAARCQTGQKPGFVCDDNPPGSGVCTAKGDGSKGGDGLPVCICKRSDGDGGTCKEECPSSSDGILRNCTPPEADGTPEESICSAAGRVESCGGASYCCPKAGGTWTKNMSACEGSAQCLNIKAYSADSNFTPLTTEELKALKAGDKVRFAVAGTATGASGSFDKAQFKINGVDRAEVTQKKPSTEEFYDEYTILATDTSITVKARIHHTTLGYSSF